jgi:hypothetical protein
MMPWRATIGEAMTEQALGGVDTQAWLPLPLSEWQDTKDTLHMVAQVVGKLRLALSPPEPQWGHVALYVTARGLSTSPVPAPGGGSFDVELDLLDHVVVVRRSDGRLARVPLEARPVAETYAGLVSALRGLDVEVAISPLPSEVPDPVPFAEDRVHSAYDREAVERFFGVLSRIDLILKEHRASFRGRTTPVNFWWGSFDLALTRFSGRPTDPPPGADSIFTEAMDAEEVSAGFWPGYHAFPEPAFYAYAHPRPEGIERTAIAPAAAYWDDDLGEFILRYEDVRRSPSPRRDILDFLESTHHTGATLCGWDSELC